MILGVKITLFFFTVDYSLLLALIKLRFWYMYMGKVNPLRAKFFRGNLNIYLHFVSFLHIDTTQVFEILPQIKQEPTYST